MVSNRFSFHTWLVILTVTLAAALSASAVAHGRAVRHPKRAFAASAATSPVAFAVSRGGGTTLAPYSSAQTVLQLNLKPGSYIVSAKAWAENESAAGDSEASCAVGGDALSSDYTTSTILAHSSETVYGTVSISFTVLRTIVFQCSNSREEPTTLKFMKLIAVKMGAVH